MSYDVFGIENPLIDLLASVPESFLEEVSVEKDKMYLIDLPRMQELMEALGGTEVRPEPGGSCANTLLGMAQLGASTAYCGKVGNDEYGRIYVEKLEAAGVTSFVKTDGQNTGSTVILVTPDAARTMNTYLGACQQLEAADVPEQALRDSKLLYMTGYLWDTETQQSAARESLRIAKDAGIPVAMSLSDPFCVQRHMDFFPGLLRDSVDLVFANREEALALTGKHTTQEAISALRELCAGAVVTLGGHGALVSEGTETAYIDPQTVSAVDTTGAGDAFAAGYLYGRTQGYSPHGCGQIGSHFAANVITRMGPRLDGDVRGLLSEVLAQAA